jgi:hypothetical protein
MATRAGDAGLLQRKAWLRGALAERLQASGRRGAAAVSCRRLHLSPARWLAGLAALGDVLYLSGHARGGLLDELVQGVLLESMVLAPLQRCDAWWAASAITVDGPREWIECRDADGQASARLYLLPDTDYLAWDALQAGAGAGPACEPMTAAPWRPAGAHLLRFHTRALAGLQVFGAERSRSLSPLSRQLAGRILRDEGGGCRLAGCAAARWLQPPPG